MHAPTQDLHARFQPLLLFFVDGANFINAQEPEWDLLLAIRKLGHVTIVVRASSLFCCTCS